MKEHEMIPTVLSIIIVVMGLGLNLTTNITNQTSGVATPLDPMGQTIKQMQSDNKTD